MKKFFIRKLILGCCIAGLLLISKNSVAQYDPLPDGYYNIDIGEPELPSVTKYWADDDVYELSAGGYDTWGNADEANFVYFETEEDKEVVVRVHGFVGDPALLGWNSKGFIMIRSSLDDDASMCFLEATGPEVRDAVYLSGRRAVAGSAAIFGEHGNVVPLLPRWLKFVRQGKYITGYHKDDMEGAQWQRVATVELALKGKAYLGIGACGGGSGTGYVTVRFDKLEVRDIEIPYEVLSTVSDQRVNVDKSIAVDVTNVFGHYIGDYWTIQPTSSDERIATVSFGETQVTNPADGEEFRKLININGIKDGIVAVNIFTNISGFKMSTEFIVEVKGTTVPSTITHVAPQSPWTFGDLDSTLNPNPKSWMAYSGDMNNEVNILTNLSDENGPADNLAFLYRDFNASDSIQIIALIDSVKNTGKGSFAGFMFRQAFDTLGTSPFVAFSAGAYQGLRFNYRWYNGGEVEYLDENNIKLPCWIRINKFRDAGIDYVQSYYSYDNFFWTPYLKYPFNIRFLNNNIVGGFVVSGGNYSLARGQVSIIKNISVKINKPFDPINSSVNINPEPLKIVPNPVSDNATITYNVIKPGVVTLSIYDSYGILKDVLVNEYQGINEYSVSYNPENLGNSGIYLLRLVSGNNYQFVRFIYNK